MKISGNIDLVGDGTIKGWVFDEDAPLTHCEVLARTADGHLISEAVAMNYRDDLECNGIGDGRHAFELIVPCFCDEDRIIEVVEKKSNLHIAGSPIHIKGKIAATLDQFPTILFDIGDLILYLECHDNPTGIQRVICGVLNAMIQESLFPLHKIKPVYYNTHDGWFYYLNIHEVNVLIEDIQKPLSLRKFSNKKDRKQLFLNHASIGKVAFDNLYNHILFTLGAAWVFKGYFIAVRNMKLAGMRFAVLIHDLMPILLPKLCHFGTVKVFKMFIRHALQTADLVLSVSNNTKNDIISYCEAQGSVTPNIKVVKNGQNFKKCHQAKSSNPICGDYVLYVSTIEGRKNHILAIDAWENLIAKYGDTVPSLVFVGRGGWYIENLAEKLRDTNFLNGKVVILSEVADDTLTSLYEKCLFTIYPSLYEGWGLPVGESLYFGKACLASDASSLPEVGGDLALYFSSNSLPSFFEKLEKLLFDLQFRQELEDRIHKEFSPIEWSNVATNVLSTIPEIMQTKPACNQFTLRPGEYSFAALPDLGQEIADFNVIKPFSNSFCSTGSLVSDSYFYLECALKDGLWFDPESWGRWGHIDGNSLMFSLIKDKPHILIMQVAAPSSFIPLNLHLSTLSMYVESIEIETAPKIIKIDLEHYTHKGVVSIGFKIMTQKDTTIEGESRKIGLGFCSMILIEKDDILQRLEVIEKHIYCIRSGRVTI